MHTRSRDKSLRDSAQHGSVDVVETSALPCCFGKSFGRERGHGGESNAKMHLVLTPVVFALRLDAAIFAAYFEKIMQKDKRKPQIPRVKKAYRRLFCAGASSMTQPQILPILISKSHGSEHR